MFVVAAWMNVLSTVLTRFSPTFAIATHTVFWTTISVVGFGVVLWCFTCALEALTLIWSSLFRLRDWPALFFRLCSEDLEYVLNLCRRFASIFNLFSGIRLQSVEDSTHYTPTEFANELEELAASDSES